MKLNKFFAFLLVSAAAFSFCSCRQGEERWISYDTWMGVSWVTEAEADEYLLSHGYSEEFIAATGTDTKKMLFYWGMEYDMQSEPIASEEVPWLSGRLTVSDLPMSGNVILKFITFNWTWTGGELADKDELAFIWSNTEYSDKNKLLALSGSTIFEIHGDGVLDHESAKPAADGTAPPERSAGTFYMASNIRWLEGGYLQQTVGEELGGDPYLRRDKLSYEFSVESGWMFRDAFYEAEGDAALGVYQLDRENYSGSFSFAFVRFAQPDYDLYTEEHLITVRYTHRGGEDEKSAELNCIFTD